MPSERNEIDELRFDRLCRRLRRLSVVPRWVVIPTIQRQNVAEHSFHVAWVYVWICKRLNKPIDGPGMWEALTHDGDEGATGDFPSPSKGMPDPSNYTDTKLMIKLADSLEMMLFIHEEKVMGNSRLQDIWDHRMVLGELFAGELSHRNYECPQFKILLSHFLGVVDVAVHPHHEWHNI